MDPVDSQASIVREGGHEEDEGSYQVDDSESPAKRNTARAGRRRAGMDDDASGRAVANTQDLTQSRSQRSQHTHKTALGRPSKASSNDSKEASNSTQAFSQQFFDDVGRLSERYNTGDLFISRNQQESCPPPVEIDETYETGDNSLAELPNVKHVGVGEDGVRREREGEGERGGREGGGSGGGGGDNMAVTVANDSDEELAELPKFSEPASQWPEERRFQTPNVRAAGGKKRNRSGEVKSSPGATPTTTPRLPVNPFGGFRRQTTGAMSMSQAFANTQAPSSPLPPVPTSDGMSERPSPHLYGLQKSNTAYVSSPAQLRKMMSRSQSDPHDQYLPMSASQEERKGQDTPLKSIPASGSDSEDLMAPDSVDTRRQFGIRQRERSKKTRMNLKGIPTGADSASRSRGQNPLHRNDVAHNLRLDAGQLEVVPSSAEQSSSSRDRPSEPANAFSDNEIDDMDDLDAAGGADVEDHLALAVESDIESDSDETQVQQPEYKGRHDHERQMEVDKENLGLTPIQVPRTISKQTRHFHIKALPGEEPGLPPYLTESQMAANSQPDAALGNLATGPGISHVPDSTETDTRDDHHSADGSNEKNEPHSQRNERKKVAPTVLRKPMTNNTIVTNPSLYNGSWDDDTPPQSISDIKLQRNQRERRESLPQQQIPDSDEKVEQSPEQGKSRLRRLSRKPDQDGSAILAVPQLKKQSSSDVAHFLQVAGSQNYHSQNSSSDVRPPPRHFGDILPDASQASQGLDLDIEVLTEGDRIFKRTVGSSPAASPAKAVSRRARRAEGLQRSSSSASRSLPGAVHRADSLAEPLTTDYYTTAQSASTRLAPISSITSPIQAPSSQPSNTSEKENFYPARDAHTKHDVVPSTQDTSSQEAQTATEAWAAGNADGPPRKRPRVPHPRIESSEPNATPRVTQVSEDSPPDTQNRIVAPTRVWAIFQGTPRGYYPAICLRPVEGDRFEVRFDDDTQTTVSASTVCRLELRVGDIVKVGDGQTSRKLNLVVTDLLEQMRSVSKKALTLVDMQGWTKVKLAIKTKDEELEPIKEPVLVKDLYLTASQFNSLSDRAYEHPANVPEDPRPATPSTCLSNPATPASRHLRAKLMLSKSTTNQSFKSSATKFKLFSGMAFATTALEQEKKLDVQNLVSLHGGVFLKGGLKPLFKTPDLQLTQSSDGGGGGSLKQFNLRDENSAIDFAAVIVGKHARTSTYLCALALNIPCLSYQWIQDCIYHGELVDWRQYLVASGESKILDGAICSRWMEMPGPITNLDDLRHWRLGSMLECRRKLFDGQNVLVVSEMVDSEKGDTIFFISYALGAGKVGFARGVKEANDHLRDRRAEWSWVCLIKGDDEAQDDPNSLAAAPKGRKRKSYSSTITTTATTGIARALDIGANIRVIDNELLIQSLVLGRLVAE